MKYEHMLHCQGGRHDKVWCIIMLEEGVVQGGPGWGQSRACRYVTVWGRRGKKLQTKIWYGTPGEANVMAADKREKGYAPVAEADQVYPEFPADLEKAVFWARLKI